MEGVLTATNPSCRQASVVDAGCAAGRYGPNCSLQCDCENGASCDPVSGKCHCRLGWIGPRCDVAHRQYIHLYSQFRVAR